MMKNKSQSVPFQRSQIHSQTKKRKTKPKLKISEKSFLTFLGLPSWAFLLFIYVFIYLFIYLPKEVLPRRYGGGLLTKRCGCFHAFPWVFLMVDVGFPLLDALGDSQLDAKMELVDTGSHSDGVRKVHYYLLGTTSLGLLTIYICIYILISLFAQGGSPKKVRRWTYFSSYFPYFSSYCFLFSICKESIAVPPRVN